MSDGKKNSDQPEKEEPRPRNPRDDFREQLKRIRDEAVGDLKKSLGTPKDETSFSRSRSPAQSPSLSGGAGEKTSARASETGAPSAPGKQRVQVTGEPLAKHREKRRAAGYKPESDVEQLLDAKDAGQYHVAATAGGMSESANGAMGLDGIRRIYHSLGREAQEAGSASVESGARCPRADPSQVEKDMVSQTTVGMKILREAYADGYHGKELQPVPTQPPGRQADNKGTTAEPSGILDGVLNWFRGSSEPSATTTVPTGVRGSQTEAPERADARKLLHDGRLRDGDIDVVLSLLDSSDLGAVERLRAILAKYRE